MIRAVIEEATGRVVNRIEIEEKSEWAPPEGYVLSDQEGGQIGDIWDGSNFVPGPTTDAPLEPRDFAAEIDELRARVADLEKKVV